MQRVREEGSMKDAVARCGEEKKSLSVLAEGQVDYRDLLDGLPCWSTPRRL